MYVVVFRDRRYMTCRGVGMVRVTVVQSYSRRTHNDKFRQFRVRHGRLEWSKDKVGRQIVDIMGNSVGSANRQKKAEEVDQTEDR